MRRIAIVSAMHQELEALLRAMPDEAPRVLAGRRFWTGHLDGHDVVAVLSGVGKVAAATTATLLADALGVERAIFTGTAGGLHPRARVGDVVVADALLQQAATSPFLASLDLAGRLRVVPSDYPVAAVGAALLGR